MVTSANETAVVLVIMQGAVMATMTATMINIFKKNE